MLYQGARITLGGGGGGNRLLHWTWRQPNDGSFPKNKAAFKEQGVAFFEDPQALRGGVFWKAAVTDIDGITRSLR